MARKLCLLLTLALTASHTASAGTDPWVRVTSDHFTVVTDEGEKEGRHVLDQFERMRWVFQQILSHLKIDPPIPIIAVATRSAKEFESLLPQNLLGKDEMTLSGLFMREPDKNYILLRPMAFQDQRYGRIYHTYSYVAFSASHQDLPLWLEEGMASFMENTEIKSKDVSLGEPDMGEIYFLRAQVLIPLPVLFKVDQDSTYYHKTRDGELFYGESWALVHFLVIKDLMDHTSKVNNYADLIANGDDPVTAAQKVFGNLNELELTLRAYIDRGDYNQLTLSSAPSRIDESTFKVQQLNDAESNAILADVLAYNDRQADSRSLIDIVLKEDPNNISTRETLGNLDYELSQNEDARKFYGEAIKLGTQNFFTYYNFAKLSIGNNDAVVENNLRTSINLNSQFAPSYDLLAQFLALRHERLAEAHNLSRQAIDTDPTIVAFRIHCADVLEQMNRFRDAIDVLDAAQKLARDREDAQKVKDTLAKVKQDQRDHPGAQAMDDEVQPENDTTTVALATPAEKYPDLPSNGPAAIVNGVIRNVSCSFPTEIEFRIDAVKVKAVMVYNNDFSKIDLTAAANVSVPQSMNPCHDFEGKKVRAKYIKGKSPGMDGEVVAVELTK